jgi:hypothetical protein
MRLALAAGCAAVTLAVPASARSFWGEGVQGDGKVTTEKRDVPEFEAVRLASSVDVAITVGPARSVAVTIDGNLQPLVTTKVERGTLVLDTQKPIRSARAARVEVTVPALHRVALDGSGDVTVAGGAGPLELRVHGSGDVRWKGEATTLDVAVEGSGDVRLEGRAAQLRIRVDGSGDVDAHGLSATDADARVEGSGDVRLNVAGGKLSAQVDGSGDIHWSGKTSEEHVVVHGSGDVSRR